MNKVLLIGRIANDVRTFTTNSGIKYTRGTIAVSRRTTQGDNADFIPFVAWRQTADFINNYAPKGTLISVEGSLVSGRYEGKNGIVSTLEVNIDNIQLLESRSAREQRANKSNTTPTFDGNGEKESLKSTNGVSFANSNEQNLNSTNVNKTTKIFSFDDLEDDTDLN
ncbi:single-stranded DNA-binding protein [Mycoplasmopsis opalescens]|uniref:single-stranded DNA-binding protein n=1 Tax=Mycoplasmopsis opalescens TaxID=114886 RepID=UPI000691FCDA|nr:single-stranded DNA-binding protein [Mycoplasmopsis opalescens]